MARGYLRIVVFVCGLLIGIQFPGFMDQYEKRVDAHFNEVEKNLAGFRETADEYFQGNLESLIRYYEKSNDPVFKADAKSVDSIYARWQMISAERKAMQGPWYGAAFHLVFFHNDEILAETFASYSYTVLFTPKAIAWGVAIGFFVSLAAELFLAGMFYGGSRIMAMRRI